MQRRVIRHMISRTLRAALLLPALGIAHAEAPAAATDPLAAALADNSLPNREGGVPPQCYTRTGARSNPCWVCHTQKNGRNLMDDWGLQAKYEFSPVGMTNHWTNLFKDRRAAIARISDEQALAYIRQDNYTPLRAALAQRAGFAGWRPDLDYRQGFDGAGFARDGSGWRAFRYKPFAGTFWPTNGSTDDVLLRLPARFREDAQGAPSADIYKINLSILEAAMAVPDTVSDAALKRRVEPLDEAAAGMDLDGDGRIGGTIDTIHGLPAHYAGAAAAEPVRRYDYPLGTEFLHSVRYVDPDAPALLSERLKELRYSVKLMSVSETALHAKYAEEARAKAVGALPDFAGNAETGLANTFGWKLQGFIEDASGALRLQTRQEQMFCLGCHTTIGVTVDQTFGLPRKVPGAAGWGHQDLAGIVDVPQAGSRTPEIRQYFERVGGGDEFRANDEIIARFFPGGVLDRAALRRAAPGGDQDIRALIVPTRERALRLDKAYMDLVSEQTFALGRDAVPAPVRNVHERLEDTATALKASGHVYRDGRLWLDWSKAGGDVGPGAAATVKSVTAPP